MRPVTASSLVDNDLTQDATPDVSTLTFDDLGLDRRLLANVAREGYTRPTPIQAGAIPAILGGRDLLGGAPTGTGKTAAFTLPLLDRLHKNVPAKKRLPRALVLAPTRELAGQIADSLNTYGTGLGLRHVLIYGGVGQGKQVRSLRQGVDVILATPGRLLDLMGQGEVDLSRVEVLVLDEADRMLDMGFVPDVRRIAAETPGDRQTLLFSATVPPTIRKLVEELMDEPVRVMIEPEAATADLIEQKVYFVKKPDKPHLLADLVNVKNMTRAVVFSRTKHGCDRIVRQLGKRDIKAVAIHGNRNQNQRQKALNAFKAGKVPLLVATDVAARGIDVDEVTHVVQYDLTHEPETYVHRIGRTGRAGADGEAISFVDDEEKAYLKAVQNLLKREIPVEDDHPYTSGHTRVPYIPQQERGPRQSPKKPKGKHPLAAGGSGAGKPKKKRGYPKPGGAGAGNKPTAGGRPSNKRRRVKRSATAG